MTHRIRLATAGTLLCLLFLTACSSAASTGGSSPANTTGAGTGPSSVPTPTAAFCQSIMTVQQVNQILQLPSDYTISQVGVLGKNCDYNQADGNIIFGIAFLPYGGISLSQEVMLTVTLAKNNGDTTATQPVSGLGDQAEYLRVMTPNVNQDYLYVVKGNVEFHIDADDDTFINSPSSATALSEFQQIAQHVLAQL